MTKQPELSARTVARCLIGGLLTADLLVWLSHTIGGWPAKALLLVCLLFLPGLALFRVMRIAMNSFSSGGVYALGLSILVMMLSGLVANQLWPIVGMQRPLDLAGVLCAWNVVTAGLIMWGIRVNRQAVRLNHWPLHRMSGTGWGFGGAALLLPFLAVLGAVRLNNGGDALLTQVAIVYGVGLIVSAVFLRRKLSTELLCWFIFLTSLSVLLMTSMRGWDIIGHDIERELRVFTLAYLEGRWDIALYRDPYNACLSITILPEMFVRLLDVSGIVVFKVILQLVFAACPVVIFLLINRYASKLAAIVGALLFICYPTFISDSAMLTRQGVAYLFFALAILIISNKVQIRRHKMLFLLCSLGAILSHYSTAYMYVGVFTIAVLCKAFITWRQGYRPWPWRSKAKQQLTILSPIFALLLFLMTFGWYARITDTSGGLGATLTSSIANIPNLFSGHDNKSSDTSTALLFAGGKTPAELYTAYVGKSTNDKGQDLPLPTLTDDTMPLTALGRRVQKLGMQPSTITALRQNYAKVLQLLALASVVYVAYRIWKKRLRLGVDFVYLNLAGLVVLTLMVLLPVLSINYGLLRAFQQSLIFLALPIALLLVRLGQLLGRRLRTAATAAGLALLFMLFTGLFAQLLGGSSPSLSMNNQGLYYGLYYTSSADKEAFGWLQAHLAADSDVRLANPNRALMHRPDYPFQKTGVLPSQLAPGSFTYLDHAQVKDRRLYIYYESSPLIMTFPLDYYDTARDRIYSTSSTRVYH